MEITPHKTQIDYSRLEKSKLLFYKNTKARRIFHYTSIAGLEGILAHKTLRFTNIKYMNDKDEIIAGLDSVAKAWNSSDEERKKLRSAFIKRSTQAFVCCFSAEEDSLPMWNYYTKEINNQGYNIEFNDKKLVESILRNNPALNGCNFSFGIVDYSKDNNSEYGQIFTRETMVTISQSILQLFYKGARDIINADESSLREWEQRIADKSDKQKLHGLPIYFYDGEKCSFEKRSSSDYLYFIKRDCFKQEQEFRIVITVPDDHLAALKEKGVYKFRVANGILIPFLELTFSPDVVKSITISPTIQSDLVELSIQDFLKYCEFPIKNYSAFIKHSNVPVRF